MLTYKISEQAHVSEQKNSDKNESKNEIDVGAKIFSYS